MNMCSNQPQSLCTILSHLHHSINTINHICNIDLQPDTLLVIEENPLLSIKKPDITIILTIQKLEGRMPDKFIAILGNPGGHTITLKRTPPSAMKRIQLYGKSQIGKQENTWGLMNYLMTNYHLCQKNLPLCFIIISTQNIK